MLKTLACAVLLGASSLASAAPAGVAQAVQSAPTFAPTRFSVVVEGSGPDVILLPGLASPRAVWDGARTALGGKYRLHLVQLNGFGGSPAGVNASGPVLEPSVEELHRYIQANRLKNVAVVGHSMGGLMGLMLARAHPEDVGKLMVVDALPFIGTLFSPAATVAAVQPQAAAMRDGMLAAARSGRKPDAVPHMSITPAGAAQVARWTSEADPAVVAEAFYEDMTTDLRPQMSSIRTPITMLYPYSAKGVSAEQAAALYGAAYKDAPNVRLVPVAESFHFIMLDQPARFAEALQAFLR